MIAVHDVLQTTTLLLIGFSVFSLAILLVAHVFYLNSRKTAPGMFACAMLCVSLAGLQMAHLQHLQTGSDLFQSLAYVVMLFATPPAFYFFSRDLLLPETRFSAVDLLHLLPPVCGLLLPSGWIAPMAFALGTAYSLWLARIVYGMRRHVGRFKFEMFFFGLFAALAVVVLALVCSVPWIGASAFHMAYANAIGIALVLITAALLIFPEIVADIAETAKLAYANSTLKSVNAQAKLAMLDALMSTDKLYTNENLSLALLAETMELSPHQLSELINSKFGVGFSRYIRERRVEEAKRILSEDQRSSALSVGMMCGFGSQSNFYAAFREVTGMSPAAFRKGRLKPGSIPE